MGIQIVIRHETMINAGWEPSIASHEQNVGTDDEPEIIRSSWWRYTKGDVTLDSYSPWGFCADCKIGGQNERLFAKVGLFELPHEFV